MKTVRNFCLISCIAILVGTGIESLRRKQTQSGFNRLNVGAISNSDQQIEGASASVQWSCIFRVSVQYPFSRHFLFSKHKKNLGRVQSAVKRVGTGEMSKWGSGRGRLFPSSLARPCGEETRDTGPITRACTTS